MPNPTEERPAPDSSNVLETFLEERMEIIFSSALNKCARAVREMILGSEPQMFSEAGHDEAAALVNLALMLFDPERPSKQQDEGMMLRTGPTINGRHAAAMAKLVLDAHLPKRLLAAIDEAGPESYDKMVEELYRRQPIAQFLATPQRPR